MRVADGNINDALTVSRREHSGRRPHDDLAERCFRSSNLDPRLRRGRPAFGVRAQVVQSALIKKLAVDDFNPAPVRVAEDGVAVSPIGAAAHHLHSLGEEVRQVRRDHVV